MTQPSLPEAFLVQMKSLLGDAYVDYLAAMERSAMRGLRINPHKPTDAPLSTLVIDLLSPVPWESQGFVLPLESLAGAHSLHEAGAYYLQEPSAMLPAALLAVQPGETVLDLCAAPGGKSTQLAAAMAGQGTLVCNEPVPNRAQIVSRNLERMGVTNALVVSADPSQLATAWPLLYDAILVDAPCSGEGMFRRHPETRLEWSSEAPARCALRQRRIVESALQMLKPGGRLCYSTCTFNRVENDELIAAVLADHPELAPANVTLPGYLKGSMTSQQGCMHVYPQDGMGEGHFVALLQKNELSALDTQTPCRLLPPSQSLTPPAKLLLPFFTDFWHSVAPEQTTPVPTAMLGETLLAAPPLPPLNGIRVLRAGLSLGQPKGKVFTPDHALAMAAPGYRLRSLPIDQAQAQMYQRGEALPTSDENLRGYFVLTLHGLALGFVKASDGWLKNHYPKGLRRP